MLLSSSEESNQRLTKGASPLGTPLREGPVRPLPAMAAGGCEGASYWSRAPGKCRQTGALEVQWRHLVLRALGARKTTRGKPLKGSG